MTRVYWFREVAWTATGSKPHLPDPSQRGLSRCGRPIYGNRRQRVNTWTLDPVGGMCRNCELSDEAS